MSHHTLPPLSRARRRLAVSLAVAGALPTLAAWPGPARAQTYPAKPVRILVGYSAGGGVDALARLLAAGLAGPLGQQVIVENRTGATGLIAADAVAKSPADGYTLLVGESGMLIASLLQNNRTVDPVKSFTPIAGIFIAPLLIVANNDFPAKTPKELIAELKARPGHYSYATSGIGTVQHLGFEILKERSGTFVVHIPYRGAAQIVPDVIGGQVPLGVVSVSAGMAQARAGKLRALAMMSGARLPGAESVPALAEALPGFDVAARLWLLAPAGLPAALTARLSEAVRGVLSAPETVQATSAQGGIAAYLSPAALGAEMAREAASWEQTLKSRKISVQ
ncbi:MAG: tripartite tricarboxylate transporter substrate-binding protein [Caldimonas sp.]